MANIVFSGLFFTQLLFVLTINDHPVELNFSIRNEKHMKIWLFQIVNGLWADAGDRSWDPCEVWELCSLHVSRVLILHRVPRLIPGFRKKKDHWQLKKSYFHMYFIWLKNWVLEQKLSEKNAIQDNVCHWLSKYSRLKRFPPKGLIVFHGIFLMPKVAYN